MPELDTQIRTYIDATSQPIAVNDLLREDPVVATPRRIRRRREWVIAVAVALLVLGLGLIPAFTENPAETPAANVGDLSDDRPTDSPFELTDAPIVEPRIDAHPDPTGTVAWMNFEVPETSFGDPVAATVRQLPEGGYVAHGWDFEFVWYSGDGLEWFDVSGQESAAAAEALVDPYSGSELSPDTFSFAVEDSDSTKFWHGTAWVPQPFGTGLILPGEPFQYSGDDGATWSRVGPDDLNAPVVPFAYNGIAGRVLFSSGADGLWVGVGLTPSEADPPTESASLDESWSAAETVSTTSLEGTFVIEWSRFDAPLTVSAVEEVWTSPPRIASTTANPGIVGRWVIPHTICKSSNCMWLESDDGLRWEVGGPQPPGGDRANYTWVEQGVILNFYSPTPTDEQLDIIASTGVGKPLPVGAIMVPGRESSTGLAICAQTTEEGATALNLVAPTEPSTTWYGDSVPQTSLWAADENGFELRSTPPVGLDEAASCSAGFLNETLYAFKPTGRTGTLWNHTGQGWTEVPFTQAFPTEIHQVIFAGARVFVLVGERRSNRSVWTSTDFVNWSRAVTPWNDAFLDTIRSGDNGWEIKATDFGWLAVAVNSQAFFLSGDGVNWDPMPTPDWVPAGPGAIDRLHISYAGGLFLMSADRVAQPESNIPEYIGRLIRVDG